MSALGLQLLKVEGKWRRALHPSVCLKNIDFPLNIITRGRIRKAVRDLAQTVDASADRESSPHMAFS